MTRYRAPQLLGGGHQLEGFSCRSTEQTTWLRNHAQQSSASSSTRVFVVTPTGDRDAVAYSPGAWPRSAWRTRPSGSAGGAGRYPQPVALLARLGVHVDHEGRGLGAGLLADAITRLIGLSEDIRCRGMLIHAETNEASDSSLHLIPELLPSRPTTSTSSC